MLMSPKHKFKALLLAGGKGTRLQPLTNDLPKCLIPINENKPILDYWLDTLEKAGINEILINTHHHRDQVVDYIQKTNASRSIHLHEAHEPELLGSAGTIHANHDWLDDAEHGVIIYADNLSNVDLTPICQDHQAHNAPFTMMLFHTPKPSECGIAELDENNCITAFIEKPASPRSNLANAGLYIVTAEAYREIAQANAFDLGFDILPKFVGRMRGYTFNGYHRDIGNHDALEHARRDAPTLFTSVAPINS